jgi:hypothetical protein
VAAVVVAAVAEDSEPIDHRDRFGCLPQFLQLSTDRYYIDSPRMLLPQCPSEKSKSETD